MQQVATSWLIYDLTNSPFLVGLSGVFLSVPFIVMSLYAGTIVDRVDRKKLLMWAQTADLVNTFLLGLLIASGNIQVWHLYASSVASSLFGAFQNPAQQAILPYLVPRSDLVAAISLNSILRKGTQIIGPSLGGISVATIGVANTFFIRCVAYLILLVCLGAISATNPSAERGRDQDPLSAMIEGFRYVRAEPVMGGILLMEALFSLFGSYYTMLVIFARDIFALGPEGLGFLQSAAGLGTIAGSLTLSAMGNVPYMGRLMIGAAMTYGASVIALAYCPWFLLALPILFVAGAAEMTMGALRTTILQLTSRRELLGRVMSLQAICSRGLGPLGSFELGAVAELVGVRASVALGAGICMLIAATIAIRVPAIWQYTGASVDHRRDDRGRRDGTPLAAALSDRS